MVSSRRGNQHIGPLIRDIRKEAGMTLDDLEDASGIGAYSLHAIECRRQMPAIETLAAIARGLDVSKYGYRRLIDAWLLDHNIDLDSV